MSYEYDIFVSYRRTPPVSTWVQNHLRPQLEQWLGAAMTTQPRIFLDVDLETGAVWPEALRHALSRSRFLVPVWSPAYFTSAWCLAEYRTMRAREDLLNLRSSHNPEGLIFPIRFNDGAAFPHEAQEIQQCDLSRWTYSAPSFAHTVEYVEFERAVRALAEEISEKLPNAPAWNAAWPAETPEPPPEPIVPVPRWTS